MSRLPDANNDAVVTRVPAMQLAIEPDDYASNIWTLLSMTFGLLVATMVEMSRGQLTFFNAVIVLNLLWCVSSVIT